MAVPDTNARGGESLPRNRADRVGLEPQRGAAAQSPACGALPAAHPPKLITKFAAIGRGARSKRQDPAGGDMPAWLYVDA